MYVELEVIAFIFVVCVHGHDIKGFDDTILFNIVWPGEQTELNTFGTEHMIVKTSNRETYNCTLPNIDEKERNHADNYKGPVAIELLSPLFEQSSCSYRLESYWTYEICHGKYVRQYHEDREGKKVKKQEYHLGYWDRNHHLKMIKDMQEAEMSESEKSKPLSTKKIEGINLPYVEIEMENGTLCDLNNKPRSVKTLYVCYTHGKHEIYSFKETSTCQYEVIILTPLLCSHPRYKPQDASENMISCHSLDGSPKKPRNLLAMKAESLKLRHRKPDETHIRVEIHPIDVIGDRDEITKAPETPVDMSPVESFLAGKNCLTGGTGWWKYEFCYGRYVQQYHTERDGSKTLIQLGRFDRAKHLEWIGKNPLKRPKPLAQRKQLSHLYSNGDICDKTGKPRQTEVKLKCLENTGSGVVSLYLLEPRYCEYILGVESPLICEILAHANEDGLVDGLAGDFDDGVVEDDVSPATKEIKS